MAPAYGYGAGYGRRRTAGRPPSAVVMLTGRATGVAFDFKQDNYAIKSAGAVIDKGSISGGMAADFSGTPLFNANGIYFDGSFFHTGFALSRLPGWVDGKFTIYAHIHNSNDTTGSLRAAWVIHNGAYSAGHWYDFCQAGQTRSRVASAPTPDYNNFSPTTIVGLTETKRAVAAETDNAQQARDGILVGPNPDTTYTPPSSMTELIFGCGNSGTGAGPLLATMESLLLVANERDGDAAVIANTAL